MEMKTTTIKRIETEAVTGMREAIRVAVNVSNYLPVGYPGEIIKKIKYIGEFGELADVLKDVLVKIDECDPSPPDLSFYEDPDSQGHLWRFRWKSFWTPGKEYGVDFISGDQALIEIVNASADSWLVPDEVKKAKTVA